MSTTRDFAGRAPRIGLGILAAVGFGCSLETAGTRAVLTSTNNAADPGSTFAPDAAFHVVFDGGFAGSGRTDTGTVPASNDCALPGTYALWADMDVQWEGTSLGGVIPVLAPGAGKLRIATLARVTQNGSALAVNVSACEAQTPDFQSNTVGEVYAIRFPDPLWDAPTMPSWSVPLRAACAQPGCALESDPLNALLGLNLQDSGGVWPTDHRDPRITFRDDDSDGYPGLTVNTLGAESRTPAGLPYTHPPVDVLLSARATKIMLGIRVSTTFNGTLTDCDHWLADGPNSRVEARAATCVQSSGSGSEIPCDALGGTGQVDFVDGNLPLWKVLKATWKTARLADGAGCAEARMAAHD